MQPNQENREAQSQAYDLLRPLAAGGMAELFLARKRGAKGFQKLVVLKTIRRELLENQNILDMFINEAHLAAKIDHPHVVHVNDLGQTGETYFIAMEYIRGQTIGSVINRNIKTGADWSISMWLRVLEMALEGLHYTHELHDESGKLLGVVHRDFTPSNIMITYAGSAKLIDFGVARVEQSTNLTQAGTIKGKTGYLSPEQCEGRPLDRRSDLFAAGVVLWEMIAQRRLFHTSMPELEIMRRITEGRIEMPTPADGAPLDPRLAAVLQKALKVDREERYQSAAEMLEDLRALLRGKASVDAGEISAKMCAMFSDEKAEDERLGRSTAEMAVSLPELSKSDLKRDQTPTSLAVGHMVARGTQTRLRNWKSSAAVACGVAMVMALGVWKASTRLEAATPSASRTVSASRPLPPAHAVVAAAVVAPPVSSAPVAAPSLEIVPVAAVAMRAPSPTQKAPRPVVAPRGAGTLDFDTHPYTSVYIGKKMIGETPLVGVPLPAGDVTLSLENKELGIRETFTISMPKDGHIVKKLKL